MAKKSKKNTKINQRIKTFFDGDPFDVGIERVSSETMSELFHAIGIYDIEHTKVVMLKAIRMIWSEADSGFRKDILTFFESNNEIYEGDGETEVSIDKDTKLDSILQELHVTQDEAVRLHDLYSDIRGKKITIEKVESKLLHLRFDDKKQKLQKSLDGVFDIDDSLEFNASLHYILYEQSFHKILTLNTKTYEYEYLRDTKNEDLVSEIALDKEKALNTKQNEINTFINQLPAPHKYLYENTIVTALRASPPKSKLNFPLLKESVLNDIISDAIGDVEIQLHEEELLILKKDFLELPFTDNKQEYNLELHVELNSLLEDIWNSKEIDFSDVINEAKAEYKEQFLKDLEEIIQDCGDYVSTLNLSQEELYAKVYPILFDLLPINLDITPKIARKTTRRFIHNTKDEIVKYQRQTLLAGTIRDFKNLFPQARAMRRKLILHIGPTNSGKTYQAMQKLQEADTGYYLAPLRLLALEGYENLKAQGADASLITGEEDFR